MAKIKILALSVLISLFLIPVANIFAQEQDPILYQEESVTETEDTEYELYTNDELTEDDLSVLTEDFVTDDPDPTTALAVFIATMGIFMIFPLIIGLATYIFTSLAFAKIGKELGYKNSWFAWFPLLSTIMLMQLGEKSAWWILVPFVGQIMMIVAIMRITERRGYDKLLGLIILTGIGGYVLFYLLAWSPKTVNTNTGTISSQPSLEQEPMQTTPVQSTPPVTQ